MEHQYAYPAVRELRPSSSSPSVQDGVVPRTQRDLVRASLLRCPDAPPSDKA